MVFQYTNKLNKNLNFASCALKNNNSYFILSCNYKHIIVYRNFCKQKKEMAQWFGIRNQNNKYANYSNALECFQDIEIYLWRTPSFNSQTEYSANSTEDMVK